MSLQPLPPLFVVGCGAKKKSLACPASELYTGPHFTATLAYARSKTTDENIRILSALHGFVPLHRVLEPYNVTWNHRDCIAIAQLREQIPTEWLEREWTLLMGSDYVVKIGYALSTSATMTMPRIHRPLTGMAIGIQRQWLKNNTLT